MSSRLIRFSTLGMLMLAIAGGSYAFMATAEAQPAAAPGKSLKDVVKSDTVYAKVEGETITGKDVLAFVSKLPPQLQAAPGDKLLELIVNQMVNDRLVAKAAAAEKLDQQPDVAKRIQEAKEQVIRDAFVEKKINGKVTDAAVKKKYDELVKNVPAQDEIRASHILVKDQKTADDVLAQLKKGGDFAALAKKYSIDPTKDNGGDLGYFVRSAMVKEFGDAVFAMKKGETTKTAVKTQFGFHIIKVTDRRPQEKPKFDAVKDQIRGQLTEEQVRNIVKNLRDKAKVEITLPKA
jgi:peptidyl-prolyl cis-trans isomerase C